MAWRVARAAPHCQPGALGLGVQLMAVCLVIFALPMLAAAVQCPGGLVPSYSCLEEATSCAATCPGSGVSQQFCEHGCEAYVGSMSACLSSCDSFCFGGTCANVSLPDQLACQHGCRAADQIRSCCGSCLLSCNAPHGVCSKTETSQTCACSGGYSGSSCTTPPPSYLASINASTMLTAFDGYPDNLYGWTSSISGSMLAVGANRQDAVYVYSCPTPSSCELGSRLVPFDANPPQNVRFGDWVTVSGSYIIVFAIGARPDSQGGGYIFSCPTASTCDGGTSIVAFDGGRGEYFGATGAAVSGSMVAVGAYAGPAYRHRGALYVFNCPTATTCDIGTRIDASDGVDGDYFGYAVVMSGSILAVSAPRKQIGDNARQGAVYMYDCPTSTTCSFQSLLVISNGAPDDTLGTRLSMSGSKLVVGATGVNDREGAAYIFDCPTASTCSEGYPLYANDGPGIAGFGFDVDIVGSMVLVGAVYKGEDEESAGHGAAYVFHCPTVSTCTRGKRIVSPETINMGASTGMSESGGFAVIGAYRGVIGGGGAVFPLTICPPGIYGTGCTNQCSTHCASPCDDFFYGSGTGTCDECALGWEGPLCDTCAPGWFEANGDCTYGAGFFGTERTACACAAGFTCADGIGGDGDCLCLAQRTLINGDCVVACPAASENGTTWPDAAPGSVVEGTCIEGYASALAPTRQCQLDSVWHEMISDPCSRLQCEALPNEGNATWPLADSLSVAVGGSCLDGWSGTPSRDCDANGTWTEIANECTRNVCAETTEGNAVWNDTDSLETAFGTCVPGFEGTPSRVCMANGTFGVIQDDCVALLCPFVFIDHATWDISIAGTSNIIGVCDDGHGGSPSRDCLLDGTWGEAAGSCAVIYCAALNDSVAMALWTSTAAGSAVVNGICYPGTTSAAAFPTRTCDLDGNWTAVSNPCITDPCAPLTNNRNADWPAPLVAGEVVTGTCAAGYNTTEPPPLRLCQSDGTWSDIVTNECLPLFCSSSNADFNAHHALWPSELQAGSTANGTCLPGYSTGSDATTARSCSLEAEWSLPSPLCIQITCPSMDDGIQSWPATAAGARAGGTCSAGYEGTPSRDCDMEGSWGAVEHECVSILCEATAEGSATWNATRAGESVVGTCMSGYNGTVSRSCSITGNWTVISGACSQITCPYLLAGDAQFPTTAAGSSATGQCVDGYDGSPTRACDLSGTWLDPSGACLRLQCEGELYANANWPTTDSLSNGVLGSCVLGWTGSPTRGCSATGTWSHVETPCTRLACAASLAGNAFWSAAFAGDVANGTCLEGYHGAPTRMCSWEGTWNATIISACAVNTCPGAAFGNALFDSAEAGTIVRGSCLAGFVPSSGQPERRCLPNGTWSTDFVDTCVPVAPPSVVGVAGLACTSKTSTTVSLAWQSVNATHDTVFHIEVFTGAAFVTVSSGFKASKYIVNNLSEYTNYTFRVQAGDQPGTYNIAGAQTISVLIFIAPASDLFAGNVTSSSVDLRWTASPLAEYYMVYHQQLGSRATLTFVERVEGDWVRVEALAPEKTYAILLLAGRGDDVEQVGARITVATSSLITTTGEQNGDVWVIFAIVVSVVVVLALVALIFIARRVFKNRSFRKSQPLFESHELGSIGSLPNTSELALLSPTRTPLRPDYSAASSSRGPIQESTSHVHEPTSHVPPAVMRIGIADIDSSTLVPMPGLHVTRHSAQLQEHSSLAQILSSRAVTLHYVNAAQLDQELAVLQELAADHVSSVIWIAAFISDPAALVTSPFICDLHFCLHESKTPSDLSAIARDVASGLNALHARGFAHRSIDAANILLRSGDAGLVAVIAGFSNARGPNSGATVVLPMGTFVRYAAPEVFAAAYASSPLSMEDDMSADVYSFCVVLWQMVTRTIPWKELEEAEIEKALVQGVFLSFVDMKGEDGFGSAGAKIAQSAFCIRPESRPTMAYIATQLL